jgi:glycosyltransferase involved in cell wall biosynthesis
MSINFILYNLPSRSETFLNNLIIRSSNYYSRVNLILLESDEFESYYLFKKKNIFIYQYSYYKIRYLLKNMNFLFEHYSRFRNFKRAVVDTIKFGFFEKHNPQVIHILYSGIAADACFLIEKLKPNNKVIVSCRGTAENVKALINKERRFNLVYALNHAKYIHCVSENMKNKLINFGVIEKLCFVNRPAIDLKKFNSSKVRKLKDINAVFNIITTGRLNYIKGYIFVIMALKKLIENGFNVHYTIIGDGPDLEFLEFTILELNLENYIVLKGGLSQDEVLIELENADLFLLPSLSEGISNAVLEAMAMDLPIISTNVGGMNEVIENNRNGLLISSFSVDSIFESIYYAIYNYDKMLKSALIAKDNVRDNHNLELQFGNFIEKYEN